MSGDRDRTRKRRGGNPNRPSQVARERAGLTSARDYPSAFAGRDEHGVLIRSASARPSEPSGPPPLRPSEPSGHHHCHWHLLPLLHQE